MRVATVSNFVLNPVRQYPVICIAFYEQTLGYTGRFFVRGDKKFTQVVLDQLLYMEASGNYTKLITKEETITTRETFSAVLALLPSTHFLQVHKSFAVAVKHIKSIEGNQMVVGDQTIPIGRIYRAVVTQLIR